MCYTWCIQVMSGFTDCFFRFRICKCTSLERWFGKGFGHWSIYRSLQDCFCRSLNSSILKTTPFGVVLVGYDPHDLDLLPSYHKSLTLTQALQLWCLIAWTWQKNTDLKHTSTQTQIYYLKSEVKGELCISDRDAPILKFLIFNYLYDIADMANIKKNIYILI